MAFILTGDYIHQGAARTGTVEWNNGRLSGDLVLIGRLQTLAVEYDGQHVAFPEVEGTYTDHLKSGLTVVKLAEEIFDGEWKVLGNVPMIPKQTVWWQPPT